MGALSERATSPSQNPYHRIQSLVGQGIGHKTVYVETISSTQDLALELAQQGAPHGTVVIAENQSAGRGRKGARWYSPAGVNLYFTAILKPRLQLSQLSQISIAAGVAIAEALEEYAADIVGLKWPNDIWLRGKKAGGILAQTSKAPEGERFVVLLGVGLNINLEAQQIPPELLPVATSLRIETGRYFDRVAVAASVFISLNRAIEELEHKGFAGIRQRWEKLSVLTGKLVSVSESDRKVIGRAKGIDEQGALLLETGNETVTVRSGEVRLAS